MTDPLGQSQVLPYLVGLREAGFAISLFSMEKADAYALQGEAIRRLTTQAQIAWFPLRYTKKPPILSTVWDLWQLFRAVKRLHRKQPIHIVHCRSYVTALLGMIFQRTNQTAFLFDMRGFWADERVEGGIWNLKNPIFKAVYWFFKWQEKRMLQRADYIISLTRQAQEALQQHQLKPEALPIAVIPCCVDTQLFDAARYATTNQSDSLTISYLGSLGTWYLLDEMLLFFKRLLLQKPQSRFLFITPEPPALIFNRAKQMEIDSALVQVVKATRQEVPQYLAQSQLNLFFLKPSFSKTASSATKMGEALAMGLPVIANGGVGDHAYLFDTFACGHLLPDFSEASMDAAIATIDGLLQIPPERIRQAALSYFDLQQGIARYAEVYRTLWAKINSSFR